MLELLKTHFGYDSFLPHQEEIVSSVMAGNDCFVLLPTGGGKSLCYQLPALALDGLTLVVSPLIALMKDQVDGLRANGISAGFINSTLTQSQISAAQERVRQGGIKILYVAPERATLPDFKRFLASLKVGLIAIDEAHCVSEWGHEFRPAYRELQDLRRACPDVPIIALTATATGRVRDDILSQLALRQPRSFVSSFNRPNLTYAIEPKKNSLPVLLSLLERHHGESSIIYCLSRRGTEELAHTLSERGVKAAAYHAGMGPELRRDTQDRFVRDEIQVVAATIAFGMGIDKPDIRLVVHYDLPKSIEGYYQETGRAGRDGLPSECVLFYSYSDKVKHDYFINDTEDPEERNAPGGGWSRSSNYAPSTLAGVNLSWNTWARNDLTKTVAVVTFAWRPRKISTPQRSPRRFFRPWPVPVSGLALGTLQMFFWAPRPSRWWTGAMTSLRCSASPAINRRTGYGDS